MMQAAFHVTNWAAWTPERPDRAAWLAWAGIDEAADEAEPAKPPVLLRRRVSPLGQQALRSAWQVQAGREMPLVFASRNGEFDRTFSIMQSLAGSAPVSPADFSLSVHHALAGLLSIATENRRGHTAVAAGRDSLWLGLIEAVAMLNEAPDEAVLLVYYDAPLSSPYDQFAAPGEETIALALEIGAGGPGHGVALASGPASSDLPERRPGERLMKVLLSGEAAVLAGEMQTWHLAPC